MNADTITLVVGTYKSARQVKNAVCDLYRAGFREHQITIVSRDDYGLTGEVSAVLVGLGLSPMEASLYQEASNAGETHVVVEPENRYGAAQLILDRNGSCDPCSHGLLPEDAGPVLVGMPLRWDTSRN